MNFNFPSMEPQSIANLFSALRDGELRELHMEEGTLQFQVLLPKLAALRGEGFQQFLCNLSEVKAFVLQPFRNDSTEIKDLKQIHKLQLRIERAEVGEGGWIKVACAHKGSLSGALLRIKAERFTVWDEAFDALTAADLAILRGKAAGK